MPLRQLRQSPEFSSQTGGVVSERRLQLQGAQVSYFEPLTVERRKPVSHEEQERPVIMKLRHH